MKVQNCDKKFHPEWDICPICGLDIRPIVEAIGPVARPMHERVHEEGADGQIHPD